MGLFKTKIGNLTVKFYGNPKDTLAEDEVSVVYTNTQADNPRIAADFWKYAGKVLYNLGKTPAAEMLRSILIEKIKGELHRGDDILHGNIYSLRKVEDKPGHVKICQATFFKKAQPKTSFSWGGEDYYAPMSVLAFLQYIVDNLSKEDLQEVSAYLQGWLDMLMTGQLP